MLVRNKRHFTIGVVLALGFWGLFLVILSPLFDGKNGLQYADDIFNKLSKGSSYFIPEVTRSAEKSGEKQWSVTIKYDVREDAQRAAKLLMLSGTQVEEREGALQVEGSLDKILATILKDSDFMYHNQGEKLRNAYGYDEKMVMKDWWQVLDKMNKAFQAGRMFENAKIVSDVNKKVVEPGYNFYQIEPVKVSESAGILSGLLVFYVIYTIWWGFALMYLVEGIGLTMKKAARKEE